MGFFSKISGLDKLIKAFPALRPPDGQSFNRQTVRIGSVCYKNCVTVTVNSVGFFLDVKTIFSKNKLLFIPWNTVKGIEHTKVYWQSAVALSVGDPFIASVTFIGSLVPLVLSQIEDNRTIETLP